MYWKSDDYQGNTSIIRLFEKFGNLGMGLTGLHQGRRRIKYRNNSKLSSRLSLILIQLREWYDKKSNINPQFNTNK
jgi:hypothetical protein